jgi:hypothetical protein
MESWGGTFRGEISCDSTAKAVAYTPTKKSRDHADLVGIGRCYKATIFRPNAEPLTLAEEPNLLPPATPYRRCRSDG